MNSYLAANGTSMESISKKSLTEILYLFPDNSNKAISPRDFRDAFFTTWENSVIRLTNVDAMEYIGIDRMDVKSKIFLGKKEFTGTKVMSSVLLSSDVDLFFFNTKSDSDSQNFKMAFLAGPDKSLWQYSPYLEVDHHGNHLNLRLINENGTISIQGKIGVDINGIKIPSGEDISKMIIDPKSIEKSDLYFVLDSKNTLNLKKNLLSSEMDILFTDDRPSMIECGGIKSGTNFSNVPISEIIRQMIYPYLPPVVKINMDNIYLEIDHFNSIDLVFEYTLIRRTQNIESTNIVVKSPKTTILTKIGANIKSMGMVSSVIKDAISIDPSKVLSSKGVGNFSLEISSYDGSESIKDSSNFYFVYPYFYGILDEDISDNKIIDKFKVLLKIVSPRSNQSLLLNGVGYAYFIYPNSYGKLSDILDVNDNSVLDAFSIFNIENAFSPDGKWASTDYIMFKSKEEISIGNFPSEYRFIFD